MASSENKHFTSRFIQRIRQSVSFRWLILSCVLLVIGVGTTLYTTRVDANNVVDLSTKIKDVEYKTSLFRPILSNYSVQLDSPWTTVRNLISGLGAISLIVAFPQLLIVYVLFLFQTARENASNCIQYFVVTAAGILFFCCPFTSLGQLLVNTVVTPTPPVALTPTPTLLPYEETYYAYIDVKAPPYLEEGQSQVIELDFTLLDRPVEGSVPVYLKKSSSYTVSVEIQLTSFELAEQSQDILENRSIRLNETIKWNWVILPKNEVEGHQAIAWTVKIQDDNNLTYKDISSVNIDLNIKPKLGVPSWLFGREWTILSMMTTLSGAFMTFYAFKRKAEEKKIGKTNTPVSSPPRFE